MQRPWRDAGRVVARISPALGGRALDSTTRGPGGQGARLGWAWITGPYGGTPSFDADVAVPNHLAHLGHLGAHERIEFLRRRGLRHGATVADALLDVGRSERAGHFPGELVDDLARRLGRGEHAVPLVPVEAGRDGFVERRH